MNAITHKGHPVGILQRDSDPTCLVWVYYIDDPDTDAFVSASELAEVSS